MLRHSFAIAMIEAGMRYIDLTYLLGNRSLSFMEEYYKAKQEDSDSNLHLLKILEKITNQLSWKKGSFILKEPFSIRISN